MAKNKWLLISLLVFIAVITCFTLMNCNFLGIGDWRGIKAAGLALFLALSGAISALVFILQFVKIYGFSSYGWSGFILMPIFVFIYASCMLHLSKQYCH